MSGPSTTALARPWLLATALFALPALLGADPPPSPGATISSDPLFSALLIDGTNVSGRIRQIGPRGDVTLVPREGPERTIAFETLLKLTREGPPASLTPLGSLVLFPGGDRLYQTIIGTATETTLEVQTYALGHLSIPLESLLGLVLTPPEDADALAALIDRIRREPRSSEVFWLVNGDRVAAGFLGLDEKKVKFQTSTGPIALDQAGVIALGFDPTLVVYPISSRPFFELTMVDGSRMGVADARIEQGQVIATTRFGATIRVAVNELVRVHTRSSSVSYLSDRDASAEQYVGYVGPTRPYRRDTTVDGHSLRLAGQTYDRGLGTQSRTLLAYKLAPGDRRFQALVGLDDGAGPLGSVVFRVLVDGRERFVSPPLSARDTPRVIDVDVSGAKLLILVTEFGERGEVRDFADWVEARIVR